MLYFRVGHTVIVDVRLWGSVRQQGGSERVLWWNRKITALCSHGPLWKALEHARTFLTDPGIGPFLLNPCDRMVSMATESYVSHLYSSNGLTVWARSNSDKWEWQHEGPLIKTEKRRERERGGEVVKGVECGRENSKEMVKTGGLRRSSVSYRLLGLCSLTALGQN